MLAVEAVHTEFNEHVMNWEDMPSIELQTSQGSRQIYGHRSDGDLGRWQLCYGSKHNGVCVLQTRV